MQGEPPGRKGDPPFAKASSLVAILPFLICQLILINLNAPFRQTSVITGDPGFIECIFQDSDREDTVFIINFRQSNKAEKLYRLILLDLLSVYQYNSSDLIWPLFLR